MRAISRRGLLATGAAAIGGISAIARWAAADPIGLPIGLQLYTVREQAGKDFEGTLKEVAAIGYQEVELYSFFGRKAAEVRRALEGAGLKCVSAHYPVPALRDDLAASIDYAKELGLRFIICPFPGLADPAASRPAARRSRIP